MLSNMDLMLLGAWMLWIPDAPKDARYCSLGMAAQESSGMNVILVYFGLDMDAQEFGRNASDLRGPVDPSSCEASATRREPRGGWGPGKIMHKHAL